MALVIKHRFEGGVTRRNRAHTEVTGALRDRDGRIGEEGLTRALLALTFTSLAHPRACAGSSGGRCLEEEINT